MEDFAFPDQTTVYDPKLFQLGKFKVASGILTVADPWYCIKEKNFYHNNERVIRQFDVVNGQWKAAVMFGPTDMGKRVYDLWTWKATEKVKDESYWDESKDAGGIGNDAGQICIIDLSTVPQVTAGDKSRTGPPEAWFQRNFKFYDRKSKPDAGVLPAGVVSRSGFGDGRYPIHIVKKTAIVAIRVWFLEENEGDE